MKIDSRNGGLEVLKKSKESRGRDRVLMSLVAGILFVAVESVPGTAIVIRHDRNDADYRKLGEGHPWVGSMVPVGNGAVTLIDPSWVVTAAHVAEGVGPFHRTVRFSGKDYLVDRVVLHPTWGTGVEAPELVDLALMRLATPVTEIQPAGLYPRKDEMGREVLFVGWGDLGNGQTGPTKRDSVLRGATNVVDEVVGGWISFLFDEPPAGTEFEGISGPGDSGGPALVKEDGKVYIIGVSASNDSSEARGGHCTYLSREYYPRISTAIPWIEKTLAEKGIPTSFGTWMWST